MRQTNVCLNKFYVSLYPGGSCKLFRSQKKCAMKIESKKQRKKDKKMTGVSFKLIREK